MRAFWIAPALAVLCLAPPLRADDEAKKAEAKTYEVPYRLTNTKHVMIRAKINGKGPFNFILDTGAPALFVSTAVCDKLGIKPDKTGWGTFDRFAVEGGPVVVKARGRIEDPFQLKGMNALDLAGAELHGVIGYNILARYRLEFDFTKDKMGWTLLNFDPPAPMGLGGKGEAQSLEAMAKLMEFAAAMLGNRPKAEVKERGFLGLELSDTDDGVVVKSVLPKGPAAKAGIKPGDRITRFQEQAVKTSTDVRTQAAKVAVGETAKLTIQRDGESRQVAVETGEGL